MQVVWIMQPDLSGHYKSQGESLVTQGHMNFKRLEKRCCKILCPSFLQEEFGNMTGNDII